MGRPVSFDFTTGGGSPEEFLMGTVHLEPTLMHTIGNTVVLPDAPYPVKLVNGKAVHPNVAVSPAGPEPAWAYMVTIENELTGRAWSEFRGVPTGTTQIAYKDLTKFVTTIPPQTTAGMMQNWADTTEANAERSELAADRAEAPTDLMNKNLIENPASLTNAALSAAIGEGVAPVAARLAKAVTLPEVPKGLRLVTIGDSQIRAGDTTPQALLGGSPQHLAAALDGRLDYVANLGVAGEKSAGGLSRFPSIWEYHPDIVLIRYGSNDTTTESYETFESNMLSMVALTKAGGAVPITDTLFPIDGASVSGKAKRREWSERWMGRCQREGILCLDSYRYIVSEATGDFPSTEWTTDGVHLAAPGHKAVGEVWSAALAGLPQGTPRHAVTASDGLNHVANPLFLSHDGVLPSGWARSGSDSWSACTVTTAEGIPGNVARIEFASAPNGGSISVYGPATTLVEGVDYKGGDDYRLSLMLNLKQGPDVSSLSYVSARVFLSLNNGATMITRRISRVDIERGYIDVHVNLPSGTTSIHPRLNLVATGVASGYAEFGALRALNLSALGLVPRPVPDTATALEFDIDPETLTGTIADGSPIVSIASTSGDSGLTLDNGTSKPTLEHAEVNGKAVLRFAEGQQIRTTNPPTEPWATPFTIATVIKVPTPALRGRVYSGYTGDYFSLEASSGGKFNPAVNTQAAFTGPDNPETWCVVVVVYDGAQSSTTVNDISTQIAGVTSEVSAVTSFRLGANTGGTSHYLNGDIGRIKGWSRAFTKVDIAAVLDEMKAEYGIV